MSIARPHLVARIALAFTLSAAAALASDHLVQIHKVVGGVNADTEIQAIQLCMRAAGQNQFQNSKLLAYDANGENPLLIIDFDRALPNGNLGDTVLVASPRFGEVTTPPARPDGRRRIRIARCRVPEISMKTDASMVATSSRFYWPFRDTVAGISDLVGLRTPGRLYREPHAVNDRSPEWRIS